MKVTVPAALFRLHAAVLSVDALTALVVDVALLEDAAAAVLEDAEEEFDEELLPQAASAPAASSAIGTNAHPDRALRPTTSSHPLRLPD